MYNSEFARLYDELTDDYDYGSWSRHYLEIAERIGKIPVKRLLECGCGTGSMSVRWAQAGINVVGCDISEGMLSVASEKARDEGLDVRFAVQDMREIVLPRPVDAIFAPCDGVNYLTGDSDAAKFLNGARTWLKPGGVLAFDISTPAKLCAMDGEVFFEDRENVSYFWKTSVTGAFADMSLTFFARKPGGLYSRFDERQRQRAYGLDEITRLVRDAGFEDVRAFSGMGFNPARDGDERWHIAAMKP